MSEIKSHWLVSLGWFILYAVRAIIYPFIPSKLKDVSKETVLITGGGHGLGRLLATKFAKLGSRVIIWDINESNMKETKEVIEKETNGSGRVYSYFCDVSKPSSVYQVAEEVRREVGDPTMIVLNAGIVNGKKLLDLPDESIIRCFNVNILSHFWIVKAFLKSMMAANYGHIISIDSVASYYGTYYLTDYSASKAASHRLQDALSSEMKYSGYDGIRFSSIMPYFMSTGMFDGSKSRFFSIMDPEYVARKTMDAILKNRAVVFIPRIFNTLCVGTMIIPYKSFFSFHNAVFGGEMMEGFQGNTALSNLNGTLSSTDGVSSGIGSDGNAPDGGESSGVVRRSINNNTISGSNEATAPNGTTNNQLAAKSR